MNINNNSNKSSSNNYFKVNYDNYKTANDNEIWNKTMLINMTWISNNVVMTSTNK